MSVAVSNAERDERIVSVAVSNVRHHRPEYLCKLRQELMVVDKAWRRYLDEATALDERLQAQEHGAPSWMDMASGRAGCS